jgi:C-terminal processing protease CtpA/Prc
MIQSMLNIRNFSGRRLLTPLLLVTIGFIAQGDVHAWILPPTRSSLDSRSSQVLLGLCPTTALTARKRLCNADDFAPNTDGVTPPSPAYSRSTFAQYASKCLISALVALQISSVMIAPVLAGEMVSLPSSKERYWNIMREGTPDERLTANAALLDHAVGTINTMYYDNSGGINFQPRDFFQIWKSWLKESKPTLESRQGAEEGLRWLVTQLGDPYSLYLTWEELKGELSTNPHGFLGLGAMVAPAGATFFGSVSAPVMADIPPALKTSSGKELLSATQVRHLPVITALAPHSPAERSGLTVGDRIVAVAQDNFLSQSPEAIQARLTNTYNAENYLGHPDVTVAKPVYAVDNTGSRETIVAYRPMHVRLASVNAQKPFSPQRENTVSGGDAIVHYELLSNEQSTLFGETTNSPVGYIRLTRFSKASTAGFLHAVEELEQAGATSYVLDLRNNYGGVIQEAMLTASTMLRDPHAVLCYTMNSRGGFTPHDVEEYVVDTRYPGYLLSKESTTVTYEQVKRENPAFLSSSMAWSPPSAYASLREQGVKRGIHRPTFVNDNHMNEWQISAAQLKQLRAQKNIALLVNEGTASSAEVFTAALHDNGRTVAVVGTKTYGKGYVASVIHCLLFAFQ